MYDWTKHKFRSSGVGHLMTGITKTELTAKQKKDLKDLQSRDRLTDKQQEKLNYLIEKRDAKPSLSDTVTSELQKIFFEHEFEKKREISTKFTDKGTEVESQGVTLLSEFEDYPYFKNKERKENDFITGLPDVVDKKNDTIIDIKSSWDAASFPLFKTKIPTKLYWWQLQCYMWLWGYSKAKLVYALIDTPEHLIMDEIRREAWKQNMIDTTPEFEEEIFNNLTFSDLPIKSRIKTFKVERDEVAIEQLKARLAVVKDYLITKSKELK